MTVLNKLFERRSADADLNDFIASRLGGYSPQTTGFNALTHSAVSGCANLISDGVSTLPVQTYRGLGDDSVKIPNPEVISEPSLYCSDVDWRRQVMMSWLLPGNFVGHTVARDSALRPLKIEPLDAFNVTINEDKNTYQLTFRVGGKLVENPDEIVYRPGLLLPGHRVGVSQIQYAKKQIEWGLNAEHYGQQYYISGVKANGIISVPGKGTADQASEIKERFVNAAQRAHEPVVMFGDTKYQSVNLSASDTMFLESISASGQDVARFFSVPPEMIGLESGSSMTYSNIESRSRHFLQYTLNPWIVRLEKFLTSLLPPGEYVKINRDAALAVDTMTRYNAHQTAIRTGFKSVNEVRSLEELKPLPDGDQTLWPPYAFGQVGQDEPLGQ